MVGESGGEHPGASGQFGDDVAWRVLLAGTERALGDRQHARWICETAAGASPDEFVELLEEPATQRMVRHLDAMVARARTGEPIQYVVGHWGFRELDLAIDRRVLIPRPETEVVAGVAIELARPIVPERRVADLGTGSGAIGLSVARELPIVGTEVWLTDIDADALDLASANLAGIGRSAANVRVAEGSWFEALPPDLRFDVVVSNPPYVAADSPDLDQTVRGWEPLRALISGPDGLDDIRVIVGEAVGRLHERGWLVLEHGHDQGAAVSELMGEVGLIEVDTRRDLAGRDRMTIGRSPIDG